MADRIVERGFASPTGQLKSLRDLAILKRKLTSGMSNELISKEFGVSSHTITRALRAAVNEGLLQKFEDELLGTLVPEAMAACRQALKEGNATVAIELLKGAGVLRKPKDIVAPSDNADSDSLELYIKTKRARRDDRQSRIDLSASHPATFPGSGPEPPAFGGDEDDETTIFQADGFSSLQGKSGPSHPDWLPPLEGALVGEEDDGA